ncbi:GNAT family N-acetyltransferase [Neobacillus niacini]|uniref:GNAT family N-acetyltransferase n=1 Tax=Neobacillus niacini TaxID=86668 RepID=UPI0021CB578B|nr:GNAT family N-acetyltransferase [Neobacillus niacini]MCM3765179.1 GNAT family N-acetyltransferase [Neobacillus niacini]
MKKVVLKSVEQDKRKLYMEWLLLADESEEIVKGYINDGEMFSVLFDGETAGVVLFTFQPGQVVEVKNMALAQNFRGMGLGKTILQEAFEIYRAQGMQKMIVGTANSSIANLAFYQKAGFRISEIKKDFFKKYPEPIYEYGIRALDMVMFEKNLQD